MRRSFIDLMQPLIVFAILLLFIFTGFRLGFILWQGQHINQINDLYQIMLNGLRIDLSSIGYLLLIPALLHPILFGRRQTRLFCRLFFCVYFTLVITSVLLLELSTPPFIQEYGLRPNRLFIEYLIYPTEVFNMLLNGHLLAIIVTLLVLALVIKAVCLPLSKKLVQPINDQIVYSYKTISCTTLLLVILCALAARGTLGHRPINPAFVYFSTDPLINSLTLNSAYSVAHAYKEMQNEQDAAKIYGNLANEDIIRLVKKETGLPTTTFTDSTRPSFSQRKPSYQGKPKNLVIILQESLGAQYVSALGGLPLTPNIDQLYDEGWGFEQLYATGTRSVRGIEAVITGFTPTPARAVVKLDKSQKNFFTIAGLLKNQGYHTQFIYGGESHFDNMKSFFLGNGFNEIIDFDDIKQPDFVATWGASDEDLFNQANRELNKLSAQNQPFFSFIFTSSNHDPFEIPDNKITPIQYSEQQLKQFEGSELKRHQAIQYADYALGKFIKQAKTQAYWQDTVFLIVADHDARALGKNLVPINNFHIPAVILNSSHARQKDNNISSQIDLAPTLLSLIGVENDSPMLGRDLTQSTMKGRALMQYAENFAYLTDNGATILRPNKSALAFGYDPISKSLTPKTLEDEEANVALAHALWGSLAFQQDWYRYVLE